MSKHFKHTVMSGKSLHKIHYLAFHFPTISSEVSANNCMDDSDFPFLNQLSLQPLMELKLKLEP